MRVDFTIVPVLARKHQMDTAALEHIFSQADIPSGDLPDVEDVLRYLVLFAVHNVFEISELVLWAIGSHLLGHELLLDKHLFVEEALASGEFLERVWDPVVTIADDADEEVILIEPIGLLLNSKAVVVVDQTL